MNEMFKTVEGLYLLFRSKLLYFALNVYIIPKAFFIHIFVI